MAVEIIVNWNFIGEGEKAQVAYRTPKIAPAPMDEDQEGTPQTPEGPDEVPIRVLTPTSSVLAPGLLMPIPAS